MSCTCLQRTCLACYLCRGLRVRVWSIRLCCNHLRAKSVEYPNPMKVNLFKYSRVLQNPKGLKVTYPATSSKAWPRDQAQSGRHGLGALPTQIKIVMGFGPKCPPLWLCSIIPTGLPDDHRRMTHAHISSLTFSTAMATANPTSLVLKQHQHACGHGNRAAVHFVHKAHKIACTPQCLNWAPIESIPVEPWWQWKILFQPFTQRLKKLFTGFVLRNLI